MNKLTRTGQWLWREGEISITRYYELTKEEKIEHINFLLSLKDNELSTNDIIILNFAKKIVKQKQKLLYARRREIILI